MIIEKYLTILYIYSFLGWIIETVGGYISTKKIVNRGFLIGPICPIYGIGVILINLFLQKYTNDIPILFFMSMIICGTLEYYTSYIMEKLFKARWWDNSNKKFNINGRTCLENIILFGIAGVALTKFINPLFFKIIEKITVLQWILIFVSILFIIDFIFSYKAILEFSKIVEESKHEIKDNTEEIARKVKKLVMQRYLKFKQRIITEDIKLKSIANYELKNFKKNIEFTRKTKDIVKNKLEKLRTKVDITAKVKEQLYRKNWSIKRLLKVFPNLKINSNNEEHKKV